MEYDLGPLLFNVFINDIFYLYNMEPCITMRTNPGRFGPGSFRPGSFRPESFRPNFGVGRFGLGRWVDSALGRFGPGSLRPKSIQNVDCLGQADKRRIKVLY